MTGVQTCALPIWQYGLGYVFVDQSASLLSKVAFANSYATLALSQKLRSDVQTISSAMNLTDEQKQALNTLPVGTAVVRLADEHPEPFLVKIPLSPIREGCVPDSLIKAQFGSCTSDTGSNRTQAGHSQAVSPIPVPDKKEGNNRNNCNNHKDTRPPSPGESREAKRKSSDSIPGPPRETLSREAIRFLSDIIARPLSTTVSRYQRLNLSRRRGNAIRESLARAGVIERVVIATRSGQVVLYQLTQAGRAVASGHHIDPGPAPRESLEHKYWVGKAARHFENKGYAITREHPVKGNGAIDILATRPGQKIAVEVETGKSNIKENLSKIRTAGFDRIVLIATSPAASGACQRAIEGAGVDPSPRVDLMSWLDL